MLTAPSILHKSDNFKALKSGCFGNRLKNWTAQEFLSIYRTVSNSSKYAIRYLGDAGGAWCIYRIERADVPDTIKRIMAEGAELSRITINEMAPPQCSTLNCEYLNIAQGFLHYSTANLPMREALALHAKNTSGLQARVLLRSYLTEASYSDLEALFELYPDHVIELSAFSCFLGDLPGRNAVVWEVRKY